MLTLNIFIFMIYFFKKKKKTLNFRILLIYGLQGKCDLALSFVMKKYVELKFHIHTTIRIEI